MEKDLFWEVRGIDGIYMKGYVNALRKAVEFCREQASYDWENESPNDAVRIAMTKVVLTMVALIPEGEPRIEEINEHEETSRQDDAQGEAG